MRGATDAGLLRRATIGDQLRRHAANEPDRPVVIFYGPSGREVITYGELNARANRLAASFARAGVGRGDVVAMISRNSPDYITAYYAALKLGARFTGINFTFKEREISYQLEHARPKVVIAEGPFLAQIDAVRGALPWVGAFIASNAGGALDAGWTSFDACIAPGVPPDEPDAPVDEDDIAMLVYTSGTEAFPKGVMISHQNYLISTTPSWQAALGISPSDRWLFLMPFHTIAGIGSMTTLTLVGACLVLVHSLDAASALTMIADEGVTIVAQTPTFYLQMMQQSGFADADLSKLTRCMTYGGLVPRAMIDGYRAVAPDLVWGTYWGQSELSQLGSVGWFSSLEQIPDQDPSWIGKPVPHLEVRVVDDDGNDAEEGELICRSPSVMQGYLDDAERTAEVMRGGWLHTGDIVRRDASGNMFFVDRKKDMIKTGGMNVSSVEVERALYEHAGVLQVAVVGIVDDVWSEAVTAFVVLKPDASVEPDELIAHCKERLASFKAPKAVHIVDELPKDTQGKILKRELRKQFARA